MKKLCGKPTANGLPCALKPNHKGDHKRAAQIELRK
jgi:hypothetical protein